MSMAEAMASLSYDVKSKVGCVLVKDNYIVSAGFNGTPKGAPNEMRGSDGKTLDTVIHAEMNAVSQAAKSTISTEGAIAYTTMYPCLRCAIHLYQAGIKEIVYLKMKDNHAEQNDASKWFKESNIQIRRVKYEQTSYTGEIS